MENRTVLVDVDGVLADLVGALCKKLNNARVGAEITEDTFGAYEFRKCLSDEDYKATMRAMSTRRFAAELAWYKGAPTFLYRIQRHASVYAVTAPFRSHYWMSERLTWLAGSGLLDSDRIVFCDSRAKHLIRGNILVEDNAETAYQWAEWNDGHAILFDRPWNRKIVNEHARVIRVYNYAQLEGKVRELLG